MNNIKVIMLFILQGIALINSAQTFDRSKYNEEKENVLNVVINSPQFDSIYSAKRVYFNENELLLKSSPIILEKNKRKVKVLDDLSLKRRGLDYITLGDFTMIGQDPTKARVQCSSTMTKKTLNVMLKKIDGDWVFDNYLIVED
jgi:hypothetical protein